MQLNGSQVLALSAWRLIIGVESYADKVIVSVTYFFETGQRFPVLFQKADNKAIVRRAAAGILIPHNLYSFLFTALVDLEKMGLVNKWILEGLLLLKQQEYVELKEYMIQVSGIYSKQF